MRLDNLGNDLEENFAEDIEMSVDDEEDDDDEDELEVTPSKKGKEVTMKFPIRVIDEG